ncbi:proprotein convertase subtilisin/kexin type 7-like [Symsagittifera roscoffensis]|uniref:proprotein convertase subtilisin/kexin type 7-like n=1 Tax=Symsagittifera roscoffensis TaxID=84072 RepID=UPI00307C9E55
MFVIYTLILVLSSLPLTHCVTDSSTKFPEPKNDSRVLVFESSSLFLVLNFDNFIPKNCAYNVDRLGMLDSSLNYQLTISDCDWSMDLLRSLIEDLDLQFYNNHDSVLEREKRTPTAEDLIKFEDQNRLRLDNITDPEFGNQWHLVNRLVPGNDVECWEVWEAGILGDNTHVAIIDDGVEWQNPDIQDNFCWKCSYDLNGEDGDPTPRLDIENGNHHGTRCAGLIGAVANNVCGVGVAPRSKIGGIRVLDGVITDALESRAYHVGFHSNDIYSCSWGPKDNGTVIDGPHKLTKEAMIYAANVGRNGRGALIVVASGNGASYEDSCAFDGYASSVYTLTIGAIDSHDQVPGYCESCSGLLGLAYSGGDSYTVPFSPGVTTTDWLLGLGTGCTDSFSGTSASAPLAAGIYSLVLEARPCLIVRDVFWITALTSRHVAMMTAEVSEPWSLNGAGLYHTNKHGFGILSATRLVKAALVWPGVPWMTIFSTPVLNGDGDLKFTVHDELKVTYNLTEETASEFYLYTIEQVVLTIKAWAPARGAISGVLTSPAGSKSRLIPTRKNDLDEQLLQFNFNSLHFFGESPVGAWKLTLTLEPFAKHGRISQGSISDFLATVKETLGFGSDGACLDKYGEQSKTCAVLHYWRLTFHGSPLPHEEVAKRIKLVEEAQSLDIDDLKTLSMNLTCSQRLIDFGHNEHLIPYYVLKTLCLLELFIGLMGVWIILEDLVIPMCCCVEEDENENLPLLPHQAEPAVSEGEKLRGACEDRVVHCLSSVKSCCNRLCAGKLNNRVSQVVNDEELLPLSPS